MTRVLEGIDVPSGARVGAAGLGTTGLGEGAAGLSADVFKGVLAALPLPATALVLSMLMAVGLVSAVQTIIIEL